MTGPRKRTLALATLTVSGVLVWGTANSSEAAPKKGSKPGNHSTSVKKKNQGTGSQEGSQNANEPSDASDADAIRLAALKRTEASPRAAIAAANNTPTKNQEARSAPAPKAAPAEHRKTAASPDQPGAEASDLKAALSRRQAWSEPRVQVLEPTQVKEPSAPSGRHTAAKAPANPIANGQTLVAQAGGNEDVIREALKMRGTPYVWGGASRGGFDCSGFICLVFKKLHGLNLPHSASAQSRLGTGVQQNELQPGDVVFFTTYRPGVSHVGIWLGENKFIHAANRRKGCRIDSLAGYYAKRYKWARRYVKTPTDFSEKNLKAIIKDTSEIPFGDDD